MNPPGAPPNLSAQVRDLCLLRGAPQDLPWSPGLLLGLLLAGTALDTAIGSSFGGDAYALQRSLLSSLVVLGLCWVALAIRRLRNRFVQTATAITAIGIAFSLMQGALLWGFSGLPPTSASAPPTTAHLLAGWLMFGLLLWQVAVLARIVRHAVELPNGLSIALVLCWLIAWWALDGALFGVAPTS